MKKILDACCSARQFWFNKNHPSAIFVDQRREDLTLSDGRTLHINPDIVCDFRSMPFASNSFYLVVFDPPHIKNLGNNSNFGKRFGSLDEGWQSLLRDGFQECWRVLKPNGTLIFKWNETSIPTSQVLKLFPVDPVIGHKSGKMAKTQWLTFFKDE